MLSQSISLAPGTRNDGQARVTHFGKIFILMLLTAVLEGAARKWVSDSLTTPLIMARDLLALYGIYYAFRHAGLTLARRSVYLLLLWSTIVCCWGGIQLIAGLSSIPIFVIGVRFWLLYLWFGCAAAALLQEQDIAAVCKVVLFLLLIMTPLAVVQHFLPPGSFLNRQVDGDVDKIFIVVESVVRTTGTFSFTQGYTTFLAIACPITLEFVMSARSNTKLNWLRSLAIVGCLVVSSLVSGSRAAVILTPLVFLIAVAVNLLYGSAGRRRSALVWGVASAMITAISIVVISSAFDATRERFSSASEDENINERVETIFLGERDVYARQSVLGSGMGKASNMANRFRGDEEFTLAETESGRIIAETGLLGYVFIGFKLLVCILGLFRAVRAAARTGRCFALILWPTAILCLMSWSLTGQLTDNVLGFLFVGFTLAVTRLEERRAPIPGVQRYSSQAKQFN